MMVTAELIITEKDAFVACMKMSRLHLPGEVWEDHKDFINTVVPHQPA
jgi:hypothetical protein